MSTEATLSKKARRRVRIRALEMLYGLDRKQGDDDGRLWCTPEDEDVAELPGAVAQAAAELVAGYQREAVAVDACVERFLKNWTLARMAVTDRCILRLGCYEILYQDAVPVRVAINEAIELAKEYGSEAKCAKLVNGVLDRIAREHRGDEMRR